MSCIHNVLEMRLDPHCEWPGCTVDGDNNVANESLAVVGFLVTLINFITY